MVFIGNRIHLQINPLRAAYLYALLNRFETSDEKKLTELQEGASSTRCRIRGLVVNNLIDTLRRLTQLSSSEIGGVPSTEIEDDGEYLPLSKESEVELVRA